MQTGPDDLRHFAERQTVALEFDRLITRGRDKGHDPVLIEHQREGK